ncbi:MAG: lysylphosphatidylglycerol synthase transmembrane domain-containing protein [Mobilitalea sp.]
MKNQVISGKNQIRSIVFVLLVMGITVWVLLREYSITEIIHVIEGIHPFYVIAGICMMFLFAGCQAMNFYMILKSLGHTASYGYCLEYAYVGNYFGSITPGASGGQPAQLYYMNKDEIHVDISAITVFFMVFVSQLGILVLGAIFAIIRYPMFSNLKNWMKYLLLAGGAIIFILTLILVALMFLGKLVPYLGNKILKVFIKLRIVKKPELAKAKMEAFLLSYNEKSKILLKHPELFIKVFVLTLLQWIAYYMVAYLVYLSFGYRNHSAIDLISGQAMINIAVAAVPLPGSVGIAEKAYLMLFGQFYSLTELPSAMILSRMINFYLPLFISFLVYLLVHFRIVKKKKQQAL